MTRPSRNFFRDTFAPFHRFIRTRGEKVIGTGTGTELSELLLLLLMVLARYMLAHPPKLGWLIKKITRDINGDCSDINDYVFLCSSWESYSDNPFARRRDHVHNIIMATHRGCVYAGLWCGGYMRAALCTSLLHNTLWQGPAIPIATKSLSMSSKWHACM